MRISSRTRRLRNISSVGARVCLCMCVDMTYDATIDTGESELGCDSLGCGLLWGHGYVSTSLLKIAISENKRGGPHYQLGVLSPNLIRSHAPRLPGTRPSSAVHLFGTRSR
jgi:hypothetical protein